MGGLNGLLVRHLDSDRVGSGLLVEQGGGVGDEDAIACRVE